MRLDVDLNVGLGLAVLGTTSSALIQTPGSHATIGESAVSQPDLRLADHLLDERPVFGLVGVFASHVRKVLAPALSHGGLAITRTLDQVGGAFAAFANRLIHDVSPSPLSSARLRITPTAFR